MSEESLEIIRVCRQQLDDAISQLKLPSRPSSLYDPIRYALGPGGKRVRPLLVMLSYRLFGDSSDEAIGTAISTEIFHTFTLIHDDIMDKADTRRGRPSVHKQWDEAIAILSGDMMMGLSYKLVHQCDIGNTQALQSSLDHMMQGLCEGQALDGEFETRKDVGLDEYLNMIGLKTGALLRFCTQAGGYMGGASEDQIALLDRFGENLGLGFQIQDDLLDLTSEDPKWGKPIGGDLTEGKKTYLSLKAKELVRGTSQQEMLDRFFNNGGIEKNEVDSYRSLFDEIGVLDLAREEALAYYTKATDSLKGLPDLESRSALESIANDLAKRLR